MDVNGKIRIEVLYMLTLITATIFLCFRMKKGTFIMTIVFASISRELFIGIMQLLGFYKSGHCLYAITGSFQNPGPYGGFLSVCISLLAANSIKNGDCVKHTFLSNLSYWVIIAITITATAILPSTQSRSAILALGCSMLMLAIGTKRIKTRLKPILKKYGIFILLDVAILSTGAYLLKKPSADGRLFMDKISMKAMCENGLKGAGIGHFGGAYGNAQAAYFKRQIDERGKDDLDWNAINEHDRLTADCPDNAFNEYLFTGVEAGPLAMLLLILAITTAITVSYKRGTIWCYGLTALAIFAVFSFPLHIWQFQLLFSVLLAACVSDRGSESAHTEKKRIPEMIVLIAALCTLSAISILKLPEIKQTRQAEKAWKKAERWHLMEYYEYVVEECDTLLPYMKNDYRFLFAYGQSLNKTGNYAKSDSILEMGTAISSDPMFWNVMGNNSLAQGRYREAEERYKHAFYMVPNRLYPLYLLAKLYHTEGDTLKFQCMFNKIERFVPKVESANIKQLRSEIRELK